MYNAKVCCPVCNKRCHQRGLKPHMRIHNHPQLVRPARLPLPSIETTLELHDDAFERLLERAWHRLSLHQKVHAIDVAETMKVTS